MRLPTNAAFDSLGERYETEGTWIRLETASTQGTPEIHIAIEGGGAGYGSYARLTYAQAVALRTALSDLMCDRTREDTV